MTATREQIVHKFLNLEFSEWTATNWGLNRDRSYWDIGETGTYINGVPLIIDLDFEMGYLLEIVERDTGVVSYMVIVTASSGHDSKWYDGEVGTFFHRQVTLWDMTGWGLKTIEGLLEALVQDTLVR